MQPALPKVFVNSNRRPNGRADDRQPRPDVSPARLHERLPGYAPTRVVDGTYDDAVRASAALADDAVLVVSDTSWEGYTEVPRTVIEGYATIFAEVDAQLAEPPEVVVVPMGVGALAAAVVRHFAARAT